VKKTGVLVLLTGIAEAIGFPAKIAEAYPDHFVFSGVAASWSGPLEVGRAELFNREEITIGNDGQHKG
jgi:hypothetical protein